VISDIRMPDMTGAEFFLRLRDCRPALARRFVFMTGHPGDSSLRAEMARWNVPVLAKPFTQAALLAACQDFLPAASPIPA
jgi:CheY-like chemotaxis protein